MRKIQGKMRKRSGNSNTITGALLKPMIWRPYSTLLNKDFLGWPSVSAAPVRKDHITDWITSQTSKGLTFKTVELKPAAVQVTGDIAMVCYWITLRWVDKEGKGPSQTVRITHAWRKTADEWQIIGGMSMPEASSPK
jgi:uncharacterized protein DUF4440